MFDTHHHADHIYGNILWTQAGATTIAFKEVAEELKRFEPARWLAAAKTRQDVAELTREGVPRDRSLPNRTAICRIDEARMPPNQLHCQGSFIW